MQVGNLYVDMDGVLAGCDQGLANLSGVSLDHFFSFERGPARHQFWLKVLTSDVRKFFATLPFEPNATKLIEWISTNHHRVNPQILSKPIREPNSQACIDGKKEWLRSRGILWPAIFEAAKYKYASHKGIPNVLIDDFDDNIFNWNRSGGIGILYRHDNIETVLEQLEFLYGNKNENK